MTNDCIKKYKDRCTCMEQCMTIDGTAKILIIWPVVPKVSCFQHLLCSCAFQKSSSTTFELFISGVKYLKHLKGPLDGFFRLCVMRSIFLLEIFENLFFNVTEVCRESPLTCTYSWHILIQFHIWEWSLAHFLLFILFALDRLM